MKSVLAEYRVVHKPRVAVRKSPSVAADAIGVKKTGDSVRVTSVKDGWIELDPGDGGGWILIDGKSVNLGMLMELVRHDLPLRLVVMNPLVLGEQKCELEVAEDWTVLRTKQLCASKMGLRAASMIPARGKMGERVSEAASLKEDLTLHQAGFREGDEFAFIYLGNLEKELGNLEKELLPPNTHAEPAFVDESESFGYTKGSKAEPSATSWLRCLKKNPAHKARLILFNWTGNRGGQGSAHNFTRGPPAWASLLPEYELLEINWTGRGTRMKESLHTDLKQLTKECVDALIATLSGGSPFIFFGFAFGAIIAMEVAREMQRRLPGEGPLCLVAVSCEGPSWENRTSTKHKLGVADFESMLRDKGGTDFILNDEGMKKLYVPVIKADIQLEETYKFSPLPRLRCPVLAIFGRHPGRDEQQTQVDADAAGRWLEVTSCQAASRVESLDADWYLLQEPAACDNVIRLLSAVAEPHL